MRDTKWTETVDMDPPDLPEAFWQNAGVTPVIGCVEAKIGDEVMLLGEQEGVRVTVEELAAWGGTIPYEILTGFSERVPRR